MKISELIIMIFVIAIFSTGFIGFYAAVLNSNGLTAQNFTSLNNTTATVTAINRIYNDTVQSQNNTGLTGSIITFAPVGLLFGAFNAVMQAFTLPAVLFGMIGDLGALAGIPVYVTNALIAIVGIMIISAIIYLIIGRPF